MLDDAALGGRSGSFSFSSTAHEWRRSPWLFPTTPADSPLESIQIPFIATGQSAILEAILVLFPVRS